MAEFDEARVATEEMFANTEQTPQEDIQAQEEPAPENQVADDLDEVEEQKAVLDDAVKTAEVAAQAAQERDLQLQQAMQEIEQIRAQNQQMQGTIEELSKKNEQNLIEDVLEMPTLDINNLAFADEETIKNAEAEYARKMAKFVKGDVLKEISPFVEQAKEGIYQREKEAMVSNLSQVPELQGINEMLPQIEKIIQNNRWLQSEDMPMDEKLINAYAIARGVNAINTPPEQPKELTDEEVMELYNNRPSVQEIIEKQRLEQIKQSQQVPPFSASSGAVNAALNIKEKPQTFEDAEKATRKLFGLE
jgi:hypothetical protein